MTKLITDQYHDLTDVWLSIIHVQTVCKKALYILGIYVTTHLCNKCMNHLFILIVSKD